MPTRVIKNEPDGLAIFRNLFCHRVEEGLEDLGVTVRDDEADQLAIGWVDRADNILSNVAAEVSLGGARTPLNPPLPRTGIPFKACFISKEDLVTGIFQEIE